MSDHLVTALCRSIQKWGILLPGDAGFENIMAELMAYLKSREECVGCFEVLNEWIGKEEHKKLFTAPIDQKYAEYLFYRFVVRWFELGALEKNPRWTPGNSACWYVH